MIRTGVGSLAVVAALGMLGGGAVAFRPFFFRETVTLRSELRDTPQAAAFSRGVRLALEEHGFRAGVFRIVHENQPPIGPRAWHGSLGRFLEDPATVRFPPLDPHLPPLWPSSRRTDADPGFFRKAMSDDLREVEGGAEWAGKIGIKSLYVLADYPLTSSNYIVLANRITVPEQPCDRIALTLMNASRQRGLSIAGTERVPGGDFEYRHLVARVARWKTDMVYIDAEGQGARLVRDLRARDYRGRILLSSRSVPEDYFLVAGNAKGVYSTWGIESPPPPGFDARFLARFGMAADPNAYRGYDQALAYLKAIEQKEVRTAANLEGALKAMLDPFVDCDRFAVYACLESRFDLVEVLP